MTIFKRFRKWVGGVPHLFGKLMVVWCVCAGSFCSFWALRILSHTGQDASGVLIPVLAFFGGELTLMFGKNALQGKKKEDNHDQLD